MAAKWRRLRWWLRSLALEVHGYWLTRRSRGPSVLIGHGVYAWGDGLHNDTANLQRAVDAGFTQFPPGEYRVSQLRPKR